MKDKGSKHLFIEYYGALENQNWFYSGDCTTFWTMADKRQVTDCINERIYRHLLQTMDNVRPFVPADEADWDEINKMAEAEEKARKAIKKAERINFLQAMVKNTAGSVKGMLDVAADLVAQSDAMKEKAVTTADSIKGFVDELTVLKPPRKKRTSAKKEKK